MRSKSLHWAGRALRRLGNELMARNAMRGTWIDVGAHHGETTVGLANHNPGLTIYAIEPNPSAVAKIAGCAPNVIVFPFAIAERNGYAELHINAHEAASSLLPLDEEGVRRWIGGDQFKVLSTIAVPTIRLDTFMNLMGIGTVDFLNIDAQGMDLAVVRSAGRRLQDIKRITLEVSLTEHPVYTGAPSPEEVLMFLEQSGFTLIDRESQTYGQEENLTFVQRELTLTAHHMEQASKPLC